MNNIITFKQFIDSYHSNEEVERVFVKLSKDMKKHHSNGEFIEDFSPKYITIPYTNYDGAKFSKYKHFGKMDLEDIMRIKNNNIYKFALLYFCFYLEDYDYNMGLLNGDFVKEHFDDFKELLPEDEVMYFQNILLDDLSNRSILYYSDYVENKKKPKEKVLQYSTLSLNSGNANYLILIIVTAVFSLITLLSLFYVYFNI